MRKDCYECDICGELIDFAGFPVGDGCELKEGPALCMECRRQKEIEYDAANDLSDLFKNDNIADNYTDWGAGGKVV